MSTEGNVLIDITKDEPQGPQSEVIEIDSDCEGTVVKVEPIINDLHLKMSTESNVLIDITKDEPLGPQSEVIEIDCEETVIKVEPKCEKDCEEVVMKVDPKCEEELNSFLIKKDFQLHDDYDGHNISKQEPNRRIFPCHSSHSPPIVPAVGRYPDLSTSNPILSNHKKNLEYDETVIKEIESEVGVSFPSDPPPAEDPIYRGNQSKVQKATPPVYYWNIHRLNVAIQQN